MVDSLDDIEVLQESGRLLRTEILNAVDDHRLRVILEVFIYSATYKIVYKIARKEIENCTSITIKIMKNCSVI